MNKNVLLMILDGWGISPDPKVSAVAQAHTPFYDRALETYSNATLKTYGMDVGLPKGQMGNSEVGHMNIGAGRIVYQDFARINKAIAENTFKDEQKLKSALAYAAHHNKPIHLLGLLSDGGVHSHINHLKALIEICEANGHPNTFVHAFTDGRDVDPKSGKQFIADVLDASDSSKTNLVSIIGRYYAMDRDKRWERVKQAYDLLVKGKGASTEHPLEQMDSFYADDITDEFITPVTVGDQQLIQSSRIKAGDVVIFFNFRTDRGRELTEVLTQTEHADQDMKPLDLHFLTMTNYDENFKGIEVIYDKDKLSNTLGEVISKAGSSQLRIAETEKYPHVTFFFNGGREEEFEGEKRILCPSPKVATYDEKPEMSAYEITEAVIESIENDRPNFICLNFANPDMVGHTGIMSAAVKAVETVDECTSRIVESALQQDMSIIVIADHGNCDTMVNEDKSPNTAHTVNPVPIILIDKEGTKIKDGILGDIAPTVLDLMGIDQPEEMTRHSLISK